MLAIRWLKLLFCKKKKRKKNETIIVTFHYAGVVLSLIPPGHVAPGVGWCRGWGRWGGGQQQGTCNSGAEREREGERAREAIGRT